METKKEGDPSLKVIDILEALSQGGKDGLALTEVADKSGLSKSTVHRILAQLVKRNYVIRNESNKKYYLSYKWLQFGNVLLDHIQVKDVARPYLQNLNDLVEETVHLIQRDGNFGVYIDKINCKYSVGLLSYVGKRIKLHCTAAGKLFLAHMTMEERNLVLDETGLEKMTEHTIVNRLELEKELEKCLSQGYAWNMKEDRDDVISIASPIYDARKQLVAAVSIAGPSYRFTLEKAQKAIEPLLMTTNTISAKLGYTK